MSTQGNTPLRLQASVFARPVVAPFLRLRQDLDPQSAEDLAEEQLEEERHTAELEDGRHQEE